MTTTIVITVPHAACASVRHLPGHLCDLSAEKAARCVAKHLRSSVSSRIFANTWTPRFNCDMNRWRCRHRPYRTEILTYVQDRKNNVAFVLDAHSFPADFSTYARWEVLVLDDFQPRASYTVDFVGALKAKGINAGWLQGARNDIHVQMRTVAKVPSFLLEFNEGISNSRLENLICPAVAGWLSEWKKP